MVYATYFMWFGGWFIIVLPPLTQYLGVTKRWLAVDVPFNTKWYPRDTALRSAPSRFPGSRTTPANAAWSCAIKHITPWVEARVSWRVHLAQHLHSDHHQWPFFLHCFFHRFRQKLQEFMSATVKGGQPGTNPFWNHFTLPPSNMAIGNPRTK